MYERAVLMNKPILLKGEKRVTVCCPKCDNEFETEVEKDD